MSFTQQSRDRLNRRQWLGAATLILVGALLAGCVAAPAAAPGGRTGSGRRRQLVNARRCLQTSPVDHALLVL